MKFFSMQINGKEKLASETMGSMRVVSNANGVELIESAESLKFATDRDSFFLYGRALGFLDKTGEMVKLDSSNRESYFSQNNLEDIQANTEGNFILVKVSTDGSVEVINDKYGKRDVFYHLGDGQEVILSDSLEAFSSKHKSTGYDQAALLYASVIYGSRAPKKSTFYKGIQRLGVSERVEYKNNTFKLVDSEFVPREAFEAPRTEVEKEKYLNRYSEALMDAVKLRSNNRLNVVFMSSGWDSSTILSILVHLYGPSEVKCVIGKMLFSDRSGVANKYEIERAHAITDHFGVELQEVEFDYNAQGAKRFETALDGIKNLSVPNITPVNWKRLTTHIRENFGTDLDVFCGEISDGAHNLGFSQFVSLFHPSLEFREYSDKMRSYLFGPTFLSQIEKKKHKEDLIYQIFNKGRNDLNELDSYSSPEEALLKSFFLSPDRLPGSHAGINAFITEKGQAVFEEAMEAYLKPVVEKTNQKNVYSAYLHLYNSFHWQGSTVAGLSAMARADGLEMSFPYWDMRVQNFLAEMPETWGRGLDLHETKFPLKWFLRNKIKNYPFHLQVGPHSYLYDTDHSFNHNYELAMQSSFTDYMKNELKSTRVLDILDPDLFKIKEMNELKDKYVSGGDLTIGEVSHIFFIFTLSKSLEL